MCVELTSPRGRPVRPRGTSTIEPLTVSLANPDRAINAARKASTNIRRDPRGQLLVALGVDLRHVGAGVTEQHLRRF